VSDVTRLLDAAERGESKAAQELLPLVYGELRRLAAAKMATEQPGQTLQPTALVHEAWLRLLGSEGEQQSWEGRGHFFAVAAESMRRILIDRSRRKASLKRGGRPPLEELDESQIETDAPSDELLAVHEALDQLQAEDPLAAKVVKLRYFVGMTIPEVADVLGIAPRTVDRHWLFARAWLKRALRDQTSL
jgi:RNA polymerase sigma factor (TIGR02999 family)